MAHSVGLLPWSCRGPPFRLESVRHDSIDEAPASLSIALIFTFQDIDYDLTLAGLNDPRNSNIGTAGPPEPWKADLKWRISAYGDNAPLAQAVRSCEFCDPLSLQGLPE